MVSTLPEVSQTVAAMSCQSTAINLQSSTSSRQPAAVNIQPAAVSGQPSTVSHQLSAVSRHFNLQRKPSVQSSAFALQQLPSSTFTRQPSAISRQHSAFNLQLLIDRHQNSSRTESTICSFSRQHSEQINIS